MSVDVKLQVFEGPLDLLLHLIDKNKINIYDIPIVEITDQYMEYLHDMQETDLNIMSEFMLMAATLLDIKCKMLLPAEVNEEGEEEDPRTDLVQQLLEYKMYKTMSYELKDREIDTGHLLARTESLPEEVAKYKPPVDLDELLGDLTLNRLNDIFREVMSRNTRKIDPIRSTFGKIEQEEVRLDDKIAWLEAYVMGHRSFMFRELLTEQKSRMHVIVTFLAVLEFIKSGILKVSQDTLEDDIKISVISANRIFDMIDIAEY